MMPLALINAQEAPWVIEHCGSGAIATADRCYPSQREASGSSTWLCGCGLKARGAGRLFVSWTCACDHTKGLPGACIGLAATAAGEPSAMPSANVAKARTGRRDLATGIPILRFGSCGSQWGESGVSLRAPALVIGPAQQEGRRHGTSMKSGAARNGDGTTETVYQLERSHPETEPPVC